MTSNEKRKLSKAERDAFALVGRIGGKATVKKHGKKHLSDIGKKGAQVRWANKEKVKNN